MSEQEIKIMGNTVYNVRNNFLHPVVWDDQSKEKYREWLALVGPTHPSFKKPMPWDAPPFDWRTLLVKYMAHVGREEGETYVPRFGSEFVFTTAELAALEAIDVADVSQYRAPGGYMVSGDFPSK